MPPKKRRKKSKQRTWLLPLFLCLLVGGTFWAAAKLLLFLSEQTKAPTVLASSHKAKPEPERPSNGNTPSFRSSSPAAIYKYPSLPKVAIIIDDMGYKNQIGNQLIELALALSFAFLPFGPFTQDQVQMAAKKGRDILLHLPMEPDDKDWNPGPGALMLTMSDSELAQTFRDDLATVPLATGVNNHMGSAFSEDKKGMSLLVRLLHEQGLFFVDSLTSPDSLGYDTARNAGVPVARRDIFLDNEQDPVKITSQIRKLLSLAERRGSAVGIGHSHEETLAALIEMEQEIKKRAQVVGIRELLE